MTNQITLEEALKLVSFWYNAYGEWEIGDVLGNVHGDVHGSVDGNVRGNIRGFVERHVYGSVGLSVHGSVHGSVWGTVDGDIKSDEWQRVESPRQKLKRLIEVGADKETLLQAVYQLEGN